MPLHAPRTGLATHTVANQPPEFAPRNLYLSDPSAARGGDPRGRLLG